MKFDKLIKRIEEEDIDDVSMDIPDYGDDTELPNDNEVEQLEISEVTADEIKALIDELTPAQLVLAKIELEEIISGEELKDTCDSEEEAAVKAELNAEEKPEGVEVPGIE